MLLFVNTDGPVNGTPLIGPDEITYYDRAFFLYSAILRDGFYSTTQDYYTYSQSLHWGNYYFLGTMFYWFGPELKYIAIAKLFIYFFITIPLFFSFIKFFWSNKYAYYCSCSLCLYLPLVILNYSIVRDDLIFLLTVLSLWNIECIIRRPKIYQFISLLFVIWVLAGFRIHMALAITIYMVFKMYLEFRVSRSVKYIIFTTLIAALGIFHQSLFEFLIDNTIINNLIMLPLTILRLALSPIPWQMSDELNILLYLWYSISFFVIMFFLVLFSLRISNFSKSTFSFVVFIICYILPYSGHDGLGFRQTIVVMPFVFLCVFLPVIFKVTKSNRLYT